MTWRIKPARDAFPSFAGEWDRLNHELFNGHPLLDSRFVGPLLDVFADGRELLCIHDRGTGIDGALILRPRGVGRWTSFLPSQAQIGPLLMREALPLEALFFALPGYAWSIDLLAVDPDFAPDWAGFRAAWRTLPYINTMSVDLAGGFEAYWQARSKQLRKNLQRYRRDSETQGANLSLALISDPTAIVEALERYCVIESSGWKGRAGTAVRIGSNQAAFYSTLMERFAATGDAAVSELCIGPTAIASRLMIRNGSYWIILKTTYDESLAALAPGRQHLFHLLRELSATGTAHVVDFYTNADRNQAQWATRRREIAHHQIFRNSVVAGLHTLVARRPALLPSAPAQAEPDTVKESRPATVEAFASVEALPSDVARVLEEGNNPEASSAWYANLHATVFPKDDGVCHYASRYAGLATACLPLRHWHRGVIRGVEALGNYYTSLFGPAMSRDADPLDLATIIAHAGAHRGAQPHVIRLEPMDPESLGYAMLMSGLRSAGWMPFRFFCFGNWFLEVRCHWDEYLAARDSQLRNTLKRKGRKFNDAGGILEIVTSPTAAEAAIDAYGAVYSHSWKRPEPFPDFVPGLIRWLAEKGWLRMGFANLEGKPIAAQVWIVHQDKASIFKLAYDEAHADTGVGTLLTAHLMRHVIEVDRVREVDFLIGDDSHKRQWMDRRRERWGIVAYNPRTLVGAALLVREIIGRAGRALGRTLRMQDSPASQTLTWRIEPITRFNELASDWDRLQAATTGVPFLESLFLRPLLAEFGSGREVLAIALRQGEWCAAAILFRSRLGVWETFQPSQLPLGAWISSLGADEAASYNSLLRALPGVNVVLNITQQDSLLKSRPDDTPTFRTTDYIDTASVEVDRPFDAYWSERGKNLRTNTRKQRAKLEIDGVALRLECITAPEEVAEAIADYGALESAGWKGCEGTAVHPANAQGRFYIAMLQGFCAADRGHIYRYRFDDKIVAMDLCIESGDRIVILKTAYDESYKAVSPSTLMRHDEFRLIFAEARLKRIEFYGKVMEWHTRWTDNARAVYHLAAYRLAVIAQLHAASQSRRANAKRATTTAVAAE